jgi:hypothetical protein
MDLPTRNATPPKPTAAAASRWRRTAATAAATAALATALAACNPEVLECRSGEPVAGALSTQPGPVFCNIDGEGADTAVSGPNTWVDDFDHGLSFADFSGTDYVTFDAVGDVAQSTHWRHADHWMVDLSPDASDVVGDTGATGGAMLRPNQSFAFENGKLVVETTFAAGLPAYTSDNGGTAWGEIDITTAPLPTGRRTGALYGYDLFPHHYTLGCRLQPDSATICSLMDNSDGVGATRLWEMSFFQQVGQQTFGGGDFVGDGSVFTYCDEGEGDLACRSTFRLELTRTSLAIFIDNQLYFEQRDIPPLPDELVEGELYVYASSMMSRHSAHTIRFHWDRLAVNPPG